MARYANNSNYRNDSLIRKESTSALLCYALPLVRHVRSLTGPVCVSSLVIEEIRRIIKSSEIMKCVAPSSHHSSPAFL